MVSKPSDKSLTPVPRCERAWRASHATGARRRSDVRESVCGSPRGEAPRDQTSEVGDGPVDHAALFWLRTTASERMTVPQAASAAAWGHSSSSPIPFRKIPRTITRK